jgi:hypothetical protein
MMHYVWKANSLYLNKIYIGKIVPLYPFEEGQDTCAAFIQTIPTGEMVGHFPNQEMARSGLLKAAGLALEDFFV